MTEDTGDTEIWRASEAAAAEPSRADRPPVEMPAGIAWNVSRLEAPVHVVDGDGASLCQLVDADDLVVIGPAAWETTSADRRCSRCEMLLDIYRGGSSD
jgi:hypothetical protein